MIIFYKAENEGQLFLFQIARYLLGDVVNIDLLLAKKIRNTKNKTNLKFCLKNHLRINT